MSEWRRAQSYPSHKHLPPAHLSTILEEKDGRTFAPHRLDMCYDPYGVVDLGATIVRLARTFQPGYTPGKLTNSHHAIFSRNKELVTGNPDLNALRQHSTMVGHTFIQIHNMFHEAFNEPDLPEDDVSRACVKELGRSTHLFNLASGINNRNELLQNFQYPPPRVRTHPTWRYAGNSKSELTRDIRRLEGEFHDFLDACPDPEVGRMPARQLLADLAMSDVVSVLRPHTVDDVHGVDYRGFTVRSLQEFSGVPEPTGTFVKAA